MSSFYHWNCWAYHSLEVLVYDLQLAFLKTRRFFRLRRIAQLEAELIKRRT